MTEWYACDLETEGLDFTTDKILSFAFYNRSKKGCLTELNSIKAWFEQHKEDKLIWHNGAFDVKFLKKASVEADLSWDTMIAESLLPDRLERLNLQDVAGKELGVPRWKSAEMYHEMSEADQDSISTLNLMDAEYTFMIFEKQVKKLKEHGLLKLFFENNLGMKAVRFLAAMEYRGIGLDYEKMQERWKENLKEHEGLVTKLYEKYRPLTAEYEQARFAGLPLLDPPEEGAAHKTLQLYEKRLKARRDKYRFNFNSPKQVLWLLREKLNFPCKDFLTGKDSVSQNVLEFYKGQHEIIDDLLVLRGNEHTSGSFYKNWDKYYREGRLHPGYHLDVTKTYRLSCSAPALQQVPRGSAFRELFIPAPGYKMCVVDYSQIEPRLIAHYSADPVLSQIFREGFDLYEHVAREILGFKGSSTDLKKRHKDIRAIAKEIALSSFYGIGPDRFAFRLRLKTGRAVTAGEARRYLDSYFSMLSGVKQYRLWLVEKLQQDPTFTTVFGRKLFFKPHEFAHLAFNKIIQNTGSDINLYSQIDLDSFFKSARIDARCVHLVHDEAVFEYKKEQENRVLQVVEHTLAARYKNLINVPIKIEVFTGENWGCK